MKNKKLKYLILVLICFHSFLAFALPPNNGAVQINMKGSNVLYLGHKNTFTVHASQYPAKEIRASISGCDGEIKRLRNLDFQVTVRDTGTAKITIFYKNQTWDFSYRVIFATPTLYLNKKWAYPMMVKKDVLLNAQELSAFIEPLQMSCKISGYNVYVLTGGGQNPGGKGMTQYRNATRLYNVQGNKIGPRLRKVFQRLRRSDTVIFTDIETECGIPIMPNRLGGFSYTLF